MYQGRGFALRTVAACAIIMGAPSAFADTLGIADLGWRTNADLPKTNFTDAVTNDNQFTPAGQPSESRWTIDLTAPNSAGRPDVYTQEVFERPVASTADLAATQGNQYAFTKYYEYLDIKSATSALDTTNNLAYFAIDLVGKNEVDQSGNSVEVGFKEHYRIRLGTDATFENGLLLSVKSPSDLPNSPAFDNKTTQIFQDADGNLHTVLTTGYETQFDNEGESSLFARVVGNTIEFVLAYELAGFSDEQIASLLSKLIFESTKGLDDPANYFWSDKFPFGPGGSPYVDDLKGPPSGNVYELDTLHAGFTPPGEVPLPGAVVLMGTVLAGGFGFGAWRRRRRDGAPA